MRSVDTPIPPHTPPQPAPAAAVPTTRAQVSRRLMWLVLRAPIVQNVPECPHRCRWSLSLVQPPGCPRDEFDKARPARRGSATAGRQSCTGARQRRHLRSRPAASPSRPWLCDKALRGVAPRWEHRCATVGRERLCAAAPSPWRNSKSPANFRAIASARARSGVLRPMTGCARERSRALASARTCTGRLRVPVTVTSEGGRAQNTKSARSPCRLLLVLEAA